MVAPGLKARYNDVYLPSKEAKHEWEEDAKKAGLPMSKFIFEAMEPFRAAKDETPKSEIVRELAEAKEETQKLRKRAEDEDPPPGEARGRRLQSPLCQLPGSRNGRRNPTPRPGTN
jgi:hypothetical protein